MRKILLLFLLLAGWAVIFSPLLTSTPASRSHAPSAASPYAGALPRPWQNGDRIQIRASSGRADVAAVPSAVSSASLSAGVCGETYTLLPGDSIGSVARDCGLSLAQLLAANPRLEDPNRVYAGQQIAVPNPLAGRGSGGDNPASGESTAGGDNPAGGNPAGGENAVDNSAQAVDAAPIPRGGFHPGAALQIEVSGLPANTPARVGMGLSSSGYRVLSEVQTGPDGHLSLTLIIPADAQPGETAFVMVTTQGVPVEQRVSEQFVLSN